MRIGLREDKKGNRKKKKCETYSKPDKSHSRQCRTQLIEDRKQMKGVPLDRFKRRPTKDEMKVENVCIGDRLAFCPLSVRLAAT